MGQAEKKFFRMGLEQNVERGCKYRQDNAEHSREYRRRICGVPRYHIPGKRGVRGVQLREHKAERLVALGHLL